MSHVFRPYVGGAGPSTRLAFNNVRALAEQVPGSIVRRFDADGSGEATLWVYRSSPARAVTFDRWGFTSSDGREADVLDNASLADAIAFLNRS